MTELNIEQERRAHIEWMVSDEQSLAKRNDMASLAEAISFNAWLAAKRSMQGSAEPVYFIRPHNFAWTNPEHNPTWCEASEDAYHHTIPGHRRICYTSPPAPVSAEPVKCHADDIAVQNFANAMSEKMTLARDKGRDGWEDCDPADLSWMLREHVEKGDPCDVANFCMMLWSLGHPIYNTRLPADMKLANDPSKKPIEFVKYQAFEDAAKQVNADYLSAPPSTDAKDSERLDFMLANDAFLSRSNADAGVVVYQLMTQNEDEEYIELSGAHAFFPAPRTAIDAAIAEKEAGKK